MTRIDANPPKRFPFVVALGRLLTLAGCCAGASLAAAHGVPIDMTVAGGALTVSHPADDYPPFVFGQVEEEGDPQGPLSLPGLGPSLLWDKPGLDIVGMADSASLVFEPLAYELDGAPQSLWYWDPTTRRVATTPAGAVLNVLLPGGAYATIPAAGTVNPITLAATVAGQTGYHNHSLMNFAMPYSAESFTPGLYGVFGRFSSNAYGPSEAFLMLFNAGVDYQDLAPASEALWLAANPGDYTLDGVVDVADYDAWTDSYASSPAMAQTAADGNGDGVVDAADYTVWRDAFHAAASTTIPEPGALALAATLAGWGTAGRSRRAR